MADATPAHVRQLSADGRALFPRWAIPAVRSKATWSALAAAIGLGVILDQALRTGRFGLGLSLTFALAAAAALLVGRLERIESRILLAAAGMFSIGFTVRASPWLLWPDLAAVLILLGLAGTFAVKGSVLDVGIAELAARTWQAVVHVVAGVPFLARPLLVARGRVRAAAPVLRGALIALPIAAVLAGLLASADPVFASFFHLNIDVGQLLLDAFFIAFGVGCAGGLLRLAASEPVARIDGPAWRLGATEVLVVLAVLDTVFLAFAAAQVLAATGAAADTLRNAGVTYADYARSGFFQLLWVSGITLVVLVLSSRAGRFESRNARLAFLGLSLSAIALTLLIDGVAFRRLSLYEEAYGFTMLRLYSHVFAVWVAIVFGILAADFAGAWGKRRWFTGATLVSGLAFLLLLNVANPEAAVVAFNTSHAQITHKIDSQYLAELSSDATASLLDSRAQIDPSLRAQVTGAACSGDRTYSEPWAAFNVADRQAAEARRAGCATS